MTDMPELKPCPFCGEKPEMLSPNTNRHKIVCRQCWLEVGPHASSKALINKWNTRADAPLTPAEAMERCPEVAALVGACSNVIWAKHGKHIEAALAPFTKGSNG